MNQVINFSTLYLRLTAYYFWAEPDVSYILIKRAKRYYRIWRMWISTFINTRRNVEGSEFSFLKVPNRKHDNGPVFKHTMWLHTRLQCTIHRFKRKITKKWVKGKYTNLTENESWREVTFRFSRSLLFLYILENWVSNLYFKPFETSFISINVK